MTEDYPSIRKCLSSIKEITCMGDIAPYNVERNAVVDHSKYLVDEMKHPLHIDVHVLLQKTAADGSIHDHWQGTFSRTLTHQACQDDPDALFTLLRQCLPFAKWNYVDYHDSKFDQFLYCFKPGEGTVEDQEMSESFFDYVQRVWVHWKDPEPEEGIRNDLHSVQNDLLEMDDRYGMFSTDCRSKWWFVLKALS